MTRSSPRSWSDRRLAPALAALILGSIVAGIALQSVLAAGLFALLYMIIDLGAEAAMRTLRPSIGTVSIKVVPIASRAASAASMRFAMTVLVRPERSLRRVLVVPVIPGVADALDPPAYQGSFRAGVAVELHYELAIDRAGTFAIPGVIVRRSSMLGLFSRSQLLCDRQRITVLPDFLSGSAALTTLFTRRSLISTSARRHVQRGSGSDFRELREFHSDDTLRRVDWKATARRGQLMVREYEEPREFTIQVIFDTSIDMAFGGEAAGAFANAADLVARLAFLARAEDIQLRLTTYDKRGVRQSRMGHGNAGLYRLLSQIVEEPRQALLAGLEARSDDELDLIARAAWKGTRRLWRHRNVDAAAAQCFPESRSPRQRLVHYIAEFAPQAAIRQPRRCRGCGSPIHSDEIKCARCGLERGEGGLTPRAIRAVEAIACALRQSRGREMLVFVSALAGGEACDRVAEYLAFAATGHRTVHVACPTMVTLREGRYVRPGSQGNFPTRLHALRNLYRLHRATTHQVFHSSLEAAGVKLHRLEAREDLDAILSTLVLTEILSASA